MIHAIWRRLRRVEVTILALVARLRAGTLRRGHSGPRRSTPRKPPSSKPEPLPRGFGWLLPLVPQHAAGYAGQMRHVLAEPEMAALIAATPSIARTLRPLCRMLGIEPGLLPPPPARAPAAPPQEPRRPFWESILGPLQFESPRTPPELDVPLPDTG